MERIQPFDMVLMLALLAMFIVGYAQGVVRRLLGIAAIIFSLILGAQLRQPVGQYLANEWTGIAAEYSFMVAFGAVFVAAAVTLSLGIQLTYRPAPLFTRYPVLDEIVGGILGVIEGFLIIIAFLLITDPYFTNARFAESAGFGEFGLLRTVHELLDPTLIAETLRQSVIPVLLMLIGFLIPQDVRDTFARALLARS